MITQQYTAKVVTVDPTQGLVEVVMRGDATPRQVGVYATPTAFRWPQAGESWTVIQKKGTWYLDAPWPVSSKAQTPITVENDGVVLTANPSNIVAGGMITATWQGISNPTPTDWIVVYPAGTQDDLTAFNSSTDNLFGTWVYLNSGTKTAGTSALSSGTVSITMPDIPKAYELRLYAAGKYTTLYATCGPISVHAKTVNDVEPGDAVVNAPTGALHVLGSDDGSTDFSVTQDNIVTPENLDNNNAALTDGTTPAVNQGMTWKGPKKGNWVNAVGQSGYILYGWNAGTDVSSLPSGVTASTVPSVVPRAVWATSTTDTRALTNAAQTQRNAATAYLNTTTEPTVPESFELTFTCATGYSGLVSVYCVDWQPQNRAQTVRIQDNDIHTITKFSNGTWVQDTVNVSAGGLLTISIQPIDPNIYNAVVSGVFFGGSTAKGWTPTDMVKVGDTAGADLSGTYPNPTVTNLHNTWSGGDLAGTGVAPTVTNLHNTWAGDLTGTGVSPTVTSLHNTWAGGDLAGTGVAPTVQTVEGGKTPVAQTDKAGLGTNVIPNPSFEYDSVAALPAGYSVTLGSNLTSFNVSSVWSASGTKSLRYTVVNLASAGQVSGTVKGPATIGSTQNVFLTSAGQQWAISMVVNLLSITNSMAVKIQINWLNSSGSAIAFSTPFLATTLGVNTYSGVVTAPASVFGFQVLLASTSGVSNSSVDAYVDSLLCVQASSVPAYFDGDSSGGQWTSNVGNSASTLGDLTGTYPSPRINPSFKPSVTNVTDTRNANSLPDAYSQSVTWEFKTSSVLGITGADTFVALQTIAQWSDDSGGTFKQFAYSTGKTFSRTGSIASGWGTWIKSGSTEDYGTASLTFPGTGLSNAITVNHTLGRNPSTMLVSPLGTFNYGDYPTVWVVSFTTTTLSVQAAVGGTPSGAYGQFSWFVK